MESYQVVGCIDVEALTQVAEYPRRIVLELKVILHPRCQFITSSVTKSVSSVGGKENQLTYQTPVCALL